MMIVTDETILGLKAVVMKLWHGLLLFSTICVLTNAKDMFETTADKALNSQALVFVVRTTPSFAPYINTTVMRAASQVIGYTNFNNPGYYRSYQLIGYANGAISYNMIFDDSVAFQNAIQALPISSTTDYECYDSLFTSLVTAITSYSVLKYPKSPIFTFGDSLPNDQKSLELFYQNVKGEYQGAPITNILINPSKDSCNFKNADSEYRKLRTFSHFTHGLVSYVPVDTAVDTIFNFATAIEEAKLLATTDFVDQCPIGTEVGKFFVDNSTSRITILATGSSLSLQLIDAYGEKYMPITSFKYGNTQGLNFSSLKTGIYSLLIFSADQPSPCQIRVYSHWDRVDSLPTGTSVTYYY